MEITHKNWHVAWISPLPIHFVQRTYNAGSHQYKGCHIQASLFVNNICIYINHVRPTLYVLSWKCGSYWADQETACSYSLPCSLNTLLVPDESNSNLHIQFHYSHMYHFVKFYMYQDRSKKTCHSFCVCEVRQSCKHTVKSGEDKAGVLWSRTSNCSYSTSNDIYLCDDECIAKCITTWKPFNKTNFENQHQKIK
jgi:hypothetical protein